MASIKGCNQPKTNSFDDLTKKPPREKRKERKKRKEKRKTKRKTKEKKKRKREKREGEWTAAKGK